MMGLFCHRPPLTASGRGIGSSEIDEELVNGIRADITGSEKF
jgi:hypothetical protein